MNLSRRYFLFFL